MSGWFSVAGPVALLLWLAGLLLDSLFHVTTSTMLLTGPNTPLIARTPVNEFFFKERVLHMMEQGPD